MHDTNFSNGAKNPITTAPADRQQRSFDNGDSRSIARKGEDEKLKRMEVSDQAQVSPTANDDSVDQPSTQSDEVALTLPISTNEVPLSEQTSETKAVMPAAHTMTETPENRALQPARPFAGLPTEWDLPPLPSPTEQLISAVSIGKLADSDLEGLQMELDSEAADVHGLYTFRLSPTDDGTRRWNVLVAPKQVEPGQDRTKFADVTIDFTRPIAEFLIDGDSQLRFQWRAETRFSAAEQLANSLLCLSNANQQQHVLPLRAAKRQDGLILNLNESVLRVPIDLPRQPTEERVVLELVALNNFRLPVNVEPENRRLKLGQQGTVIVGEPQVAELRLKFGKNTQSQWQVELRSFYTKNRRTYQLTTEDVRSEILALRRALETGRSEYQESCQLLSSVRAQLQSLRTRRPANNREAGVIVNQLSLLGKREKVLSSTVRRRSRQIPDTCDALANLYRVAGFASLLHNVAQFELRLFAEGGTGEIDLVVATSDPPSLPEVDAENPAANLNAAGPWIRTSSDTNDKMTGCIYQFDTTGTFNVIGPLDPNAIVTGQWRQNGRKVAITALNGQSETYVLNQDFEMKSSSGATLYRMFD